MRALLLVAGRGTRISRHLSGNPKSTVEIAKDVKLIEYTVDTLRKKGIEHIGLVVGYRQNVIRDILKDRNVEFFFNPFFDVTNSIASMWFAKDFIKLDEDIMIMNGDVFMDGNLYDEIINTKLSPVLLGDCSRIEQADYKFYTENGVLKKYGKELTVDETSCEYVGIAKLQKGFIPSFVAKLDEMINDQKHSVWWENVLYELSSEHDIFVQDTNGKFWAEVDYIEDYERIKQHCIDITESAL